MVRFYDPPNIAEQAVIEGILRKAGIEYVLAPGAEAADGPSQILVAEEDVPRAMELLAKQGRA
ncbi:DUF2007 domain-containing protein [Geoalkalibacter halelectricus]|uniref:DUF2007 domain-containing protein n=1 Tax=Geoalkalibacter halelectricus TaxID=2847045 RepID=A0ABY5ZGT4_9BACT|nr:DUF2007 domain-containing protein [Geoalkalibacter halelectricus]MDO3379492.1 DUF2007 domain-containing protein [Geoalkalibacter halelectricus]UWZ78084.1 DUF2007 domain-containing protein [Geoalkalibacter halelectricus]